MRREELARDEAWLDEVAWTPEGLAPVVVQAAATGEVLMLAWTSREALARTVREGVAVYWSRSRGRLWRKGERSGQLQRVREVRLDCDGDAVLLSVEQQGVACHTGRRRCFYRRLDRRMWVADEPVLVDPGTLYGGSCPGLGGGED